MKTTNQSKTAETIFAPPSETSAHDAGAVEKEHASRQTILLVEDDRSIRRYLEVILQKAGFVVLTAGDGAEAMKIALTTPVNAIVTDAIMPHLNGHELCRFIRRQAKLASLPIILLSGLENKAPANTKEDGADVYMSKPVAPTDLINCLERLL
ncbi:MAG TPA: response regulator [Pyrinomonadaceae bacterium]|jgi:DNA-binding response OmpR family regulator